MRYAAPDFYPKFKCIAGRCRHSCCVGWEIDIDEDTAEYYGSLGGETGAKLRRATADEPEPHFVLTDEGRCPFLQEDGLCELILTLGEDSLCDICAEHPRFYNEFPALTECGLGLCCEEAVRLLLEGAKPLEIICTGDGEDEYCPEPELLVLRGEIFKKLRAGSKTLVERMDDACGLMGMRLMSFDMREWKETYLGLERMDEGWTKALLSGKGGTEPDGICHERLAEYFIYRHFAAAESLEEAALLMQFAFLSVRMIAALGPDTAEITRMYSAEIEYSDENIRKLTEIIKKSLRRREI